MKISSIFNSILLGLLFIFGPAAPAISQESESMGITPRSSTDHVILTWEAPTKNRDGTPLIDLAGYKIYYDRASHGYHERKPQKIVHLDNSELSCKKIDGRTKCTYTMTVPDLGRETHYFAIKAFNTSGRDSAFSNEAKK